MTKEIRAAEHMDRTQVALNGGPPCFALMEDGRFCGCAQRWEGHDGKDEFPHHKFVSLADILLGREGLRLREYPTPAEAQADSQSDASEKMFMSKQISTLTAELEAAKLQTLRDTECIERIRNAAYALEVELDSLRKDKERLDWLDSLPDKTEFTPSEYGTTIRTAIDSAMRKKPQ